MTASPHHYRIEVVRLEERAVEVRALPVAEGAEPHSTGLLGVELLADKYPLQELAQWAEALPWPEMPQRSWSYREDIFVERRDTGGQHGWLLEAMNRHREDFTDSCFVSDDDLGSPEGLREALQWAESLGTLT